MGSINLGWGERTPVRSFDQFMEVGPRGGGGHEMEKGGAKELRRV